MTLKRRNAYRIGTSLIPVALVLAVLAASGTAQAAEPQAAGPAASQAEVSIGQIYADPLLEQSGSLHEALGFATGLEPAVAITMGKSSYAAGDTIEATEFTMKNPNTFAVTVEVKVWLTIPGLDPISIMNLGADGSLSFPASFNSSFAPFTLIQVASGMPKGTWGLSSRVLNPTTGEKYSEDLNSFEVK